MSATEARSPWLGVQWFSLAVAVGTRFAGLSILAAVETMALQSQFLS